LRSLYAGASMPRVNNSESVKKIYISFAVASPQRLQARAIAEHDGLNLNELDRMAWFLGLSRLCEGANKRLVALGLFKKQGIDLDDLPQSISDDIPVESVDVEPKTVVRFPVPEKLDRHAAALSVADGTVRAELDRMAWAIGLSLYAELMNKRLVNQSLLSRLQNDTVED